MIAVHGRDVDGPQPPARPTAARAAAGDAAAADFASTLTAVREAPPRRDARDPRALHEPRQDDAALALAMTMAGAVPMPPPPAMRPAGGDARDAASAPADDTRRVGDAAHGHGRGRDVERTRDAGASATEAQAADATTDAAATDPSSGSATTTDSGTATATASGSATATATATDSGSGSASASGAATAGSPAAATTPTTDGSSTGALPTAAAEAAAASIAAALAGKDDHDSTEAGAAIELASAGLQPTGAAGSTGAAALADRGLTAAPTPRAATAPATAAPVDAAGGLDPADLLDGPSARPAIRVDRARLVVGEHDDRVVVSVAVRHGIVDVSIRADDHRLMQTIASSRDELHDALGRHGLSLGDHDGGRARDGQPSATPRRSHGEPTASEPEPAPLAAVHDPHLRARA